MFRELSNNLMIACVATGTAAGCQSGKSEKDKAREDFQEAWSHRSPPADMERPKAVIVAQGPSPLVFQVQEPCTVHIIDATTGIELATTAAGRQALVYVSEETGAFVSGHRLAPGPFSPGHHYAISVEVGQEDSWHSRVGTVPVPPPLPPRVVTSQPAEK